MDAILRNIGSNSVDDKFYRYKRSVINVSYKNTGGGQTVIDNLDKISHDIQTKPNHIIRYLKKQLNVSCNDNIIHATITKEKLETELDNFIDKFLICPNCKLPEIKINFCAACGYEKNKPILVINDDISTLKDTSIANLDNSKSYTTSSSHSLKEYFEKCVKNTSNLKKDHTYEELAYFERKLVDQMHVLYDYAKSKKNEAYFLLDCAWQTPDIEHGDSNKFLKETISMYRIIISWFNNDEKVHNIVLELEKCSRTGNDPPEWIQTNHPVVRSLKILYSRHLKTLKSARSFILSPSANSYSILTCE
jgi:hypothetical protein